MGRIQDAAEWIPVCWWVIPVLAQKAPQNKILPYVFCFDEESKNVFANFCFQDVRHFTRNFCLLCLSSQKPQTEKWDSSDQCCACAVCAQIPNKQIQIFTFLTGIAPLILNYLQHHFVYQQIFTCNETLSTRKIAHKCEYACEKRKCTCKSPEVEALYVVAQVRCWGRSWRPVAGQDGAQDPVRHYLCPVTEGRSVSLDFQPWRNLIGPRLTLVPAGLLVFTSTKGASTGAF